MTGGGRGDEPRRYANRRWHSMLQCKASRRAERKVERRHARRLAREDQQCLVKS